MDAPRRNRQHSSDAALLAAIASRDGAAFAVFYRRYVPVVLAYLLRQMYDRETAADLTAEVFASVMLAAGRYNEQRESAGPWVLAIARDKLLISLRRGRVEARGRKRLGFQAVALEGHDLDRIEGIARVGEGRLVELVDALPEDERFAVRSRVVDEVPEQEIATELRSSEMVVRKRMSRGLTRMRAQLKETGSA